MGEFFGSIYTSLFEDWYGQELANYLWGQASPSQQGNMFITFGIEMIIVSLVVAVLYYYVIDRPRWAHWWGWCCALVVNAALCFVIGWQRTLSDFDAGLMMNADQQPLNIGPTECLAFGGTNAIIAMITFFIVSMIVKWKSASSAHVPF
jgi:hypothetical protein